MGVRTHMVNYCLFYRIQYVLSLSIFSKVHFLSVSAPKQSSNQIYFPAAAANGIHVVSLVRAAANGQTTTTKGPVGSVAILPSLIPRGQAIFKTAKAPTGFAGVCLLVRERCSFVAFSVLFSGETM